MFILKRTTSDNNQIHSILGDSYLLQHQVHNKQEFQRTMKAYGYESYADDIYAFIVYNDGANIKPLFSKSTYAVMCSNGDLYQQL